jgi:DNA topoisomerase-1
MNLVIVESPTKARKLSSYLSDDFTIESSVGHVRDLPKSKLGVDLENDFQPTYKVLKDKKKRVKKLQNLAKKADAVYLAMDPDREGEAIAWHVKYLLGQAVQGEVNDAQSSDGGTAKSDDQEGQGKDQSGAQKSQDQAAATSYNGFFHRSTFHEITKPAVLAAIEEPGEIAMNLVDAQQARRILDRLVGYKISPVLWKKVRRGLSAGRVQSVALRLIVEKEREIEAFDPEEYWEVDVGVAPSEAQVKLEKTFNKEGQELDDLPDEVMIARVWRANGERYKPTCQEDVDPVVADLKQATYQVDKIKRKERRRYSKPPFTTSTLQQTAAYKLYFSAKQTMILAQQLYEEGLITYHRTDAVNLSKKALGMARSHIKQHYGQKYLPKKARVFKGKSKNAQEAHEAIRVTDINVSKEQIPNRGKKLGKRHARLYDLIWRRFVASQMTPAVYDQTRVLIAAQPTAKSSQDRSYQLKVNGSILKFDGWMKLFRTGQDRILPDMEEGQAIDYLDLYAAQKFTQPPARYNDASLVKELEKRGIGRPSTYASIIAVIQARAYVNRVKKRFKPTVIGTTVNDFLLKYFEPIMDYDFTADMEEDLDSIARGEKEWTQVVSSFWQPLGDKIEDVTENADRVQIPVEKTGDKCPQCGEEEDGEVVIRTGKYGKFLSCSRYPDCDYTEDYVETYDDMQCPVCKEGEVVIKKTRWGKKFYGCSRYPKCDWASWKEPDKDLELTPEEWEEIKAKREAKKKKRKKKRKKS